MVTQEDVDAAKLVFHLEVEKCSTRMDKYRLQPGSASLEIENRNQFRITSDARIHWVKLKNQMTPNSGGVCSLVRGF